MTAAIRFTANVFMDAIDEDAGVPVGQFIRASCFYLRNGVRDLTQGNFIQAGNKIVAAAMSLGFVAASILTKETIETFATSNHSIPNGSSHLFQQVSPAPLALNLSRTHWLEESAQQRFTTMTLPIANRW